ncbi:3'(2'),5'-bisphosphate nucleotidase CysQ [Roseibium aquae]|uniref:3'(2'),5'-bisphosphate nucleotidase CysQ n=1 Tax=Roseibium aquae TaxID=1323746 RepID=A0A916TLF5_9HYPH|nr:3'(2'),5'-bisphosphate nucleotidase CysQ [Roseibium aquae]GGB52423.1 3'(2'),5'-bisphosphate nucleotidase CysQ [Roseibium aquae]
MRDGTATGAENQADLDLLVSAAREAGKLAMSYYGQDPKTWFKGNKSPVSEADMAVDQMLARTLRSERPAYGWLSEETADDKSRLAARRTFVADPIDGTRAFLAGGDEWTIALAVVDAGRPVSAAVFCPVREEMFCAVEHGGATLNGVPVQASSQVSVAGARLSGPHSVVANKQIAAAGFERTDNIRSLAYRLALVAAGRVDVAVARSGPSDWDLAAADLLVQEAGGALTDLVGRQRLYNQPETRHPALVAGPRNLLDAARTVISGIVE